MKALPLQDRQDRQPAGRPLPSSADELEQVRVALEDAQAEVSALAQERHELKLRLQSLEAELAAERVRSARREAAAEDMRRSFEAAIARAQSNDEKESVAQEELRVAMEELRATADELTATNAELNHLNQRLEDEVAVRTVELEEAYAKLHHEKERLQLIFEGAKDTAILTLDNEGRISAWNTGAERLLGFTGAEVMGHRLDAMWTPEDLAAREPEQEMCRALEAGRSEDDRWHLRKDGSRFWASGIMMPLSTAHGRPLLGFLKIMRDRTAARREEDQRLTLLRELDHRVKNTLAVVQAVALQSRRYAPSAEAFERALVTRLGALARSHDLLTRGVWEGASLRDIVAHTLAPYQTQGSEHQVHVAGPPLRLAPSAAVTINLAFHELATNAVKYGALSVPEGRVEVEWRIDRPSPATQVIEIFWRERGGPPVRRPRTRGFGSRLIEHGLAREFGAQVALDFAPEGVTCHIRLPFAPRVVAF